MIKKKLIFAGITLSVAVVATLFVLSKKINKIDISFDENDWIM